MKVTHKKYLYMGMIFIIVIIMSITVTLLDSVPYGKDEYYEYSEILKEVLKQIQSVKKAIMTCFTVLCSTIVLSVVFIEAVIQNKKDIATEKDDSHINGKSHEEK